MTFLVMSNVIEFAERSSEVVGFFFVRPSGAKIFLKQFSKMP